MFENIVPTHTNMIRASAETISLGDQTTQAVDIAISINRGKRGLTASTNGRIRPVRSR